MWLKVGGHGLLNIPSWSPDSTLETFTVNTDGELFMANSQQWGFTSSLDKGKTESGIKKGANNTWWLTSTGAAAKLWLQINCIKSMVGWVVERRWEKIKGDVPSALWDYCPWSWVFCSGYSSGQRAGPGLGYHFNQRGVMRRDICSRRKGFSNLNNLLKIIV